MSNLSGAMNIGLSGLRASQMGLNVAGQNIANVSTEGYTRQQLTLTPSDPIRMVEAVFGTGVQLQNISRFRDSFLDRQLRDENQLLGDFTKQAESMELIEGILNEPSDSGLHSVIENFFNSLQDLATNPESSSVRTTVREQGRAVAQMFNQVWDQLDQIRNNKNFEVTETVSEINTTLQEIAALNPQIGTSESLGGQANDLRDKRDLLLDKLSRLVDISANEDPESGSMTVSIGGRALVVMGEARLLRVENVSRDSRSAVEIINPIDNQPVDVRSGELAGMLTVRDQIIPTLQERIDELAAAMITEVNSVHREGYGLGGQGDAPPTRIDFFEGEDARTMRLSGQIESDPGNIAASGDGAPGDNTNALTLAQLRNLEIIGGSFTFEDYLGGLVSTFGLETVAINERLDNQTKLVEHFTNFRESTNGVNLDEELINLVKFQKMFGANARVLTTVNEMLEVVVMLGRY